MKKLAFYGDGLLCPPHGYSEQLVDLVVLRHPSASFQSFHLGEEKFSMEAAAKGVPFHLIGKAPDFVFLSLGHPDFVQGTAPQAVFSALESLLQMLVQKTKARIEFTSTCEAFFPEEEQREKVRVYNAGLPALANTQSHFLDINASVNAFLAEHRQGNGEKRALHQGPLRLTSMGRVFLSHTVFEKLDWASLL